MDFEASHKIIINIDLSINLKANKYLNEDDGIRKPKLKILKREKIHKSFKV